MKKALGASLQAEEQAVKSRFEKAKIASRKKSPATREQPQPEAAGEVIRDNFNLSDGEDELLSRIERRCLKAGISTNKRGVLLAGLTVLDGMQDRELERLFESPPRMRAGRHGREIHVFIVHPADAVKFHRPLQIKRFQVARKVMIGHRIATITTRKPNLMNL
jgi:hypothetical protein